MVVPKRAWKPPGKSAMVSTRWLAQVAVSARPKRKGVMMRWRRQNFPSLPQALQRFGKHPWELISDHAQLSVIHRGLLSLYQNNTHKRSVGWIAIKIYNEIKCLKVPTYVNGLKIRCYRPVSSV